MMWPSVSITSIHVSAIPSPFDFNPIAIPNENRKKINHYIKTNDESGQKLEELKLPDDGRPEET